MKRVLLSLLLLGAVSFGMQSPSALESPLTIVQGTTDQVIERVVNERDTLRDDPAKMYSLVSELIFPHFDFPIMSQLVIREHWKAASEETRSAFVDQFRKLLVRTYSIALLEFSGQEITYPNNEGIDVSAKTVLVNQEINQSGSKSIKLGYRLHRGGGDWKVFDVSIDGISLVKTYRASFSSMIENDGVDGLVSNLAEKNKDL
ncbi:MAG: ABC transporter substrate-binding protein [Pseudomonadota bacterium]